MYVEHLYLKSFRNYLELDWSPHPGFNLITGANAQGKTNLLEAIFYGLRGFSFRAGRDRELINFGSASAHLKISASGSAGPFNVDVTIPASGRKKVLINGLPAVKEFNVNRPGVVLFRPEDLNIVKGSPAERRHCLDTELGALSSSYCFHHRHYRRALVQRNGLLRTCRSHGIHHRLIDVWSEQLVEHGAALLASRLSLLKKLSPLVRQKYRQLAGDGEDVEVRYLSSVRLSSTAGPEEILASFRGGLKSVRQRELSAGQTLLGPHRDDVVFLINGVDARYFGSQGQQRTIVLALKMALLELQKRETGEQPVLLLDDVLTELDEFRQDFLLREISGAGQVFLTTTRKRAGGEKIFYDAVINIRDGKIIKEGT